MSDIRVTDEHREKAMETLNAAKAENVMRATDNSWIDGFDRARGIIATALAERDAAVWEKAAKLAGSAPSTEWLAAMFRANAQLRGKE